MTGSHEVRGSSPLSSTRLFSLSNNSINVGQINMKMKTILINFGMFCYTAIVTGVYYAFFYKPDISIVMTFIMPLFLFAPLFLKLWDSSIKLPIANLAILLGFCVGFVVPAILQEISYLPMTLGVFLVLCIPAAVIVNLLCFVAKKIKNKKSTASS